MNSIPCPSNPQGPWGTSTYRWAHFEDRNELQLFVGGDLSFRIPLDNLGDGEVIDYLSEVSERGYCHEIAGSLVRAFVDLGYMGSRMSASN
jgi:hypothetical protein